MTTPFIKYKRIAGEYTKDEIDILLDNFISEGFEIISYFEDKNIDIDSPKVNIIVIIGKRNKGMLLI